MRAVMVMFDSLNRHMLPPYGCDWTVAPNFKRLAEQSVTFENSFIASMPCMPARREIHTGRYNFLHRGWTPLEPFDDSMPELLHQSGIYSHLITDHYHYFEDGGATYHHRYSSWEFFRGQENDPWGCRIESRPPADAPRMTERQWRNRERMPDDASHSQTLTFDAGLAFIETNREQDNWYLQIETFDPHEPFFSHQQWKDLYPHDYHGPLFDWPIYRKVCEDEQTREHLRMEYAALLSKCDASLGRVLDIFDKYDLWKDTMLIVNTDHGFLLCEHDWWGKNRQPLYAEISHTPLFIWDPRSKKKGERRRSLVQTIDLAPTLLGFFGLHPTEHMQGKDLKDTIAHDAPTDEARLFGYFGGYVNVTDGRYVYMRAPVNEDGGPLFEYGLLPMHMNRRFNPEELHRAEAAGPLSFTKGCPVWKIPRKSPQQNSWPEYGTLLFDLQTDPRQLTPIQAPEVERRMIKLLVKCMQDSDAPIEQYERLGLKAYV